MVKLHVNLNKELTPTTRQLTVGLCMPRSCMSKDLESVVGELVREHVDSAPFNTTSLKTVSVRPVPGDYNIFDDVKFHIVGGVGAATIVLVFVATVYEWYLSLCRRSKNCFSDNEIECAGVHTNNNNNGVAKNREQRTISLVNGEFGNNGLMMKTPDMKNEKKPDIGQDLPSQLLLCFSALSNGKKILSLDKPSDTSLSCIHGLRFLSLAWVIMVHTYMQCFPVADNKSLRTVSERDFLFQTITNATFSVDTFFFISGLLVTILYYRTLAKKRTKTIANNKSPAAAAPQTNIGNTISTAASDEIAGRQHQKQKQLPQQQGDSLFVQIKSNTIEFVTLFVYRLLRLTPAYLFVLGIDEIALRSAHNSSVFEPGIWDHVNCDNFWWRNALYINSLFAQTEMCMVWSWYMSNDTQFYVIGVILLLISVRHFKVAVMSIVVFLVSASITTFAISYHYEYNARVEEPFALFDQLYDKPWSRIGPYLIGMVTGWFLFKIDCKLRISKPVVMLGWTLSLGCLMSLIYGIGSDGLGVLSSSFYVALGHTAWGLSLSWLTIACCTGYGGPVNSFLSCRGMLPFSRLTYCAYLVHPMLMCISSFQLDGPIHLHNGIILVIYFGNAVVSFLMSFAVSLGFEAPVVRLLKLILGGSSKED